MVNAFSELTSYEGEIWLPVPKFEGSYEISNYGRIKSLQRPGKLRSHIMNERRDNFGYLKANICFKGKSTAFSCHRMVALLFVLNPNNKPHVNHIDGNKSNCYYKNLEWCTHSENHKHAYLMGLKTMPLTKLTKEQVLDIYKSSKNTKELAYDYNVTRRTVQQIKCGDTWTHITGVVRKIEVTIKRPVLQLSLSGEIIKEYISVSDAAKSVNIGRSDISSVCKGKALTAKKFKWEYK